MTLKKEIIIDEALQLLNEDGLEGVTLRKLAKRLDVYASALYWHFKNKESLVNEMAEGILRKEFLEIETRRNNVRWQDWLINIFIRLRKSLLSYKDGGGVDDSEHLSLTMARVSEVTMKTLVHVGIDRHRVRLIVLTITRYTFGHVIEEKIVPSEENIEGFDTEEVKKNHPFMIKAIE